MGAALALAAAGVAKPAVADTSAAAPDARIAYEAWQRGDFATAIKNWRPLAIAGDSEAQYNMGQAYRFGRGVPVDLRQAEDWFRKSSMQNNMQGKAAYGIVMFQNGKRAEALPYLEEAAGHANPNAQYIYGTILFNGDLVERDYPRAYAMMTRASASGIRAASSALVQMDRVIPLAERTRGLALARAFELAESKPEIPPGDPGVSALQPVGRESPRPVRTVTLPPSDRAGLPPARVAIDSEQEPEAVRVPRPRPPVKSPSAERVATPGAGGTWRVQLGAFSNADGATALWDRLKSRIDTLASFNPVMVRAGRITRLQTGPVASRAAADKLCVAVKASGQACVTVAP